MRSTSHGIVQNNDRIGRLTYQAADGVALQQSASIDAYVDGPPGVNDTPARIVFSTTADGANTYTERMRITNGGDVLVGTTTNSISSAGIVLHKNKYIGVARDGATTMYLNRITNNGTILEFRKDNTRVGEIGSSSSISDKFYVAGDSGIQFRSDDILPTTNNGTYTDGALDIGDSGAKFRHGYFSGSLHTGGGIYIGDSSAANHLDDYEEGTWSPHIKDSYNDATKISATSQASYTKIGNVLHFAMNIYANGVASTTFTGYPYITLPFTPASGGHNAGAIFYLGYFNGIGTAVQAYVVGSGSPSIRFSAQLTNPYGNTLANGDTWGGNVRLYGTGTVILD
jgi:hypothetical protein